MSKWRAHQRKVRAFAYADHLMEREIFPFVRGAGVVKPRFEGRVEGIEIWSPSAEATEYLGSFGGGIAGILRRLWPQERIESLVYEGNPLMRMLPKQDSFFGIDRSVPSLRLSGLAFTGPGMASWKPGKMPL